MHFTLHSLTGTTTEPCYFHARVGATELCSPVYPDRRAALEAMEQLVLHLRTLRKFDPRPFGREASAIRNGPILSLAGDRETAHREIREATTALTFPVRFVRLAGQAAASLSDLDLRQGDQQYEWVETGTSILHIDGHKKLGVKPSLGIHAGALSGPCKPVFSALSPFANKQIGLYYGRGKDLDAIQEMLRHRNVMLLYGAARVGKTSLLQAGLSNRLEKEGAAHTLLAKDDKDLVSSFTDHVRDLLRTEGTLVKDRPLAEQLSAHATVGGRSLYVLIDRLEDLFSPYVYDAERLSFFQLLRELREVDNCPLRIVLSLREGFLAPLADYERELPELLGHRYRLLPLGANSMINVTYNLLDGLKLKGLIETDDTRAVSERVCRQLENDRGEVPAHCLQIYLHQLQQHSCKETPPGQPVPITTELVDRLGPPRPLINQYISERMATLRALRDGAEAGTVDPTIEKELAELENSRVDCGCAERDKRPVAVAAAVVAPPPPAGISPWWLALGLLIPFLLFWGWWQAQNNSPSADCLLAEEIGSCEAYLGYLCAHADEEGGPCTDRFLDSLDARRCGIWEDYQRMQRSGDCASLQTFYVTYRDRGVCLDRVRERLVELACPLLRDTVQLTVRDTVVREVIRTVPTPARYGPTGLAIGTGGTGPDGPPCQNFGTTTFKRVGPLWVMTEALAGGPYRWEDALDACVARGWRLPCIGEIDYLIDRIYRSDPARAYEMLAGAGECSLVNPAELPEGRIEFWTATEANDASAWTYVFDVGGQTVERQSATPKSARLPCLCVQKDPDTKGSAIPPCYQKQIDRVPGN